MLAARTHRGTAVGRYVRFQTNALGRESIVAKVDRARLAAASRTVDMGLEAELGDLVEGAEGEALHAPLITGHDAGVCGLQ